MEKLNFNRYAKNELLTTEFENKCCATAWLSAAIKAIGSLRILKNKTELVFESQDYEYIKSTAIAYEPGDAAPKILAAGKGQVTKKIIE